MFINIGINEKDLRWNQENFLNQFKIQSVKIPLPYQRLSVLTGVFASRGNDGSATGFICR